MEEKFFKELENLLSNAETVVEELKKDAIKKTPVLLTGVGNVIKTIGETLGEVGEYIEKQGPEIIKEFFEDEKNKTKTTGNIIRKFNTDYISLKTIEYKTGVKVLVDLKIDNILNEKLQIIPENIREDFKKVIIDTVFDKKNIEYKLVKIDDNNFYIEFKIRNNDKKNSNAISLLNTKIIIDKKDIIPEDIKVDPDSMEFYVLKKYKGFKLFFKKLQ